MSQLAEQKDKWPKRLEPLSHECFLRFSDVAERQKATLDAWFIAEGLDHITGEPSNLEGDRQDGRLRVDS